MDVTTARFVRAAWPLHRTHSGCSGATTEFGGFADRRWRFSATKISPDTFDRLHELDRSATAFRR